MSVAIARVINMPISNIKRKGLLKILIVSIAASLLSTPYSCIAVVLASPKHIVTTVHLTILFTFDD